VRLSWVLGLRRLGFDAWLLEEATPPTVMTGRAFFEEAIERHGLGSRAVLLGAERPIGPLSLPELEDLARESVALINISGNVRDPNLLQRFPRRAYVDLDPGFTQLWNSQGLLGEELESCDRHFTVGLNLGAGDCLVPSDGIEWIGLPPPVLLEEWRPPPDRAFDRFTTVATWRNPLGPPEAGERAFTLKHHQLRRFANLPRLAEAPFEIALDIHPAESSEAASLREAGWNIVEAASVSRDTEAFRSYVRSSGAEFSVTQGIYAETRSGWISDRTAHYLAAGRPAIVQETGIPSRYRAEEGMLTFGDMDGALAAVERVTESYDRHSAAAREFAIHTFDSDRVLTHMLEAVGV
jgi:hypothetical protein